MPDSIEMASDVITAATALAGLILVYLGAVAAGFAGYGREQQTAVRGRFRIRAWLAFVGILFSILSAALAVVGKWLKSECSVSAAIVLLLLSLVWGIGAAFMTARDI
jgi:hypothetical protein